MPLSPPLPPLPSLIIGLSGISSSGKTTIATHLATILPHNTLLHVDDFYKAESTLPLRAGHRDWDCAEALDIDGLCTALQAWLRGEPLGWRKPQGVGAVPPPPDDGNGASPPSQQQQQQHQQDPRLPATIARLCAEAHSWPPARFLILEGFLLFPPAVSRISSLLSIKLLLRATRAQAAARRRARSGYVTLDGWWEDPEGYFDDVVWPAYAEAHGRYFVDGDVEGDVEARVCGGERVDVGPLAEVVEVLEWAVGVVGRVGGGKG